MQAVTPVAASPLRSLPTYHAYLDNSLSDIGIPRRASELLEKYLGIVNVRQLLRYRPQEILAVPQVSSKTLAGIFQCLADLGFPVKGYQARITTSAKRVLDAESLSDLNTSHSCRMFQVSEVHRRSPLIRPKLVSRNPIVTQQAEHTQPTGKKMPAKKPTKTEEIDTKEIVRLVIGVSTELTTQGPYISEFRTPVPLPLSSMCCVVLVDSVERKIVHAFAGYRPVGMERDVVVYDAAHRQRVVTSAIEMIGLVPVSVDVAATYDDIAVFTEPSLSAELRAAKDELMLMIAAANANDVKGEHIADDAVFPLPEAKEEEPVKPEPKKKKKAEEPKIEPAAVVEDDVEEEEEFEDEEGDEFEEGEEGEEFDEDDEDEEFDEEEGDAGLDEEDGDEDDEEDGDEEFDEEEDEDDEEFDEEEDDAEEFDEGEEFDDDEDEEGEFDEDEEEEDYASLGKVKLGKLIANMTLEQLRPIADDVGVSNIILKKVKSEEAMRAQILKKVV